MPARIRIRGKGMTQRPELILDMSDDDSISEFNKMRKFESWVPVAEQWARDQLLKAGHGTNDLDSPKGLRSIARAADEDSNEDFAARILELIIKVRSAIKDGNAEQAAMDGVRLGQVITDQEYKDECEEVWDSGKRSGDGAARGGTIRAREFASRDAKLAREYQAQRTKSRLSPTALMEKIGKTKGLGRSQSFAAIKRGLNILSGLRGTPNK